MILCCHLKEPFVFQRKLKKKVAGSKSNKEGKKANALSKGAHGPECRHQKESANGDADKRQKTARPLTQKTLKPGVSDLVDQQDAQSFSGTDQIAQRAGFVSENKSLVRHFDWVV
jgi:hypothetical protein